MEDYEKTYEEFWKPIVENPDGSLNLDQVKRELSDFSMVMDEVPKVYDHVTGGQLTKPTTCAEWIIEAYDKEVDKEVEERVEEAKERIIDEVFDWLEKQDYEVDFLFDGKYYEFIEARKRCLKELKKRVEIKDETPTQI